MAFVPDPLIIPLGVLAGILVAAPVGPVNVLCIHRAIGRGFWGGLAAGIGATLGDGLIALGASLGVGAMPGAFDHYRTAIQIVGGVALLGTGLKLSLEPPRLEVTGGAEGQGRETLREFVWDIPKAFFLTLANPGAMLGLFAIFSGLSSFLEISRAIDALTLVLAVMGGSVLWWTGLSYVIGRIRCRFNRTGLARVTQAAGIVLAGFGGLLLGEIVLKALVLWPVALPRLGRFPAIPLPPWG